MNCQTLRFLVVLVSVGLVSCKRQEPSRPSASPVSRQAIALDSAAMNYQPRPDKRFLLAIPEIHHYFTGAQKDTPTVKLGNGHWIVSYKEEIVGKVSEFPDFPELLLCLQNWVQLLQRERRLTLESEFSNSDSAEVEAALKAFAPTALAKAASHISDRRRSEHLDPRLLYESTRLLVALTMMHLDQLEIADILPAKTLAALALTKALTGFSVVREEALLSHFMGYSLHALRMANALSISDPARRFLRNENQELLEEASGNEGTAEARYLYLLRIAESGEYDVFLDWAERYFDSEQYALPVCKAGLLLGTFRNSPEVS